MTLRINPNFKADTAIPPETPPADNTGDAQLQAEIQAALIQIQEFRDENGADLNSENITKLGFIETMLKAESAALAGQNISGAPAAGSAGAGGDGWERPTGLQAGWNGIPNSSIVSDQEDHRRIQEKRGYFGDYVGTLIVPVNEADPPKLAFQMTNDMKEAYFNSFGSDIVLTVRYNIDLDGNGVVDEFDARSWIIRGGVTDPNLTIVASAIGLSHGVTIDASKLYMVNGSKEGNMPFYVWGSAHSDRIVGSFGNDGLVGDLGNDTIIGLTGDDEIYGDGQSEVPGDGGSDTITGGEGADIIFGGGGTEDKTINEDSDDTVLQVERHNADAQPVTPPDADAILSNNDGWDEPRLENGMYVIRHSQTGTFAAVGGKLTINMPDDFTMAYAERVPDADSLIITFVNGTGSFKVKVEGFFSSSYGNGMDPNSVLVRLNFVGSARSDIIDFSRITTSSQVINIKGGGGEGADTILSPLNEVFSDGLAVNSILHSQGSTSLPSLVTQGIFAATEAYPYTNDEDHSQWNGMTATVEDYQIHIGGTPISDVLNIKLPDDFDKAYAMQDANHLYIILVKPATAVSAASTIVLAIDTASGIGLDNIKFFRETQTGNASGWDEAQITVTELSSNLEHDYLYDGEGGNDFYVTQAGTNTVVDDEDEEAVPMGSTGTRRSSNS